MNGKLWLKCLGVSLILGATVAGCGGGDDTADTAATTSSGSSSATGGNATNSGPDIAPAQSATPVGDTPKTDGRGAP